MKRLLCSLLLLGAGVTSVHGGALALFRTVFGDLEVELFDQDKPITVANFARYVQSGRYQDSILHRCPVNPVTLFCDFVVQGGGVFVDGRGTTNPAFGLIPTFDEIPNEFGVGRRFSNTYGTLAMAKRGGETNSASSQWFFNLNDNTFLDAADTNNLFVVFGHVVAGTNVLNRFKTFRPYLGGSATNVIVDAGAPLNELPLRLAPVPTEAELFLNLLYVDIALLTVRIQPQPGWGVTVSWDSVSNRLNRVEFTTQLPPAWQPLLSTNGTGGPLEVTDAAAEAGPRLYRVRVEY